jgi:hypothetical protein
MSRTSDITYRTNFGIPSGVTKQPTREEVRDPAPVRFQPEQPTNTHYSYSESQPATINSSPNFIQRTI